MNVSVIGLGKLGAPLAACLASKGFTVTGVDIEAAVVDKLNSGRAPVFEPGLQELLRESGKNLRATLDVHDAVLATDISFILVPTPSEENGRFSSAFVVEAAERIGRALREKNAYHLVVLTSTVMPRECDGVVIPCLEFASGKACGAGFGFCYNPEFVALGTVVHDLFEPDFVLIGESDPKAGDLLASLYRKLCTQDPPLARMSTLNAELTKLSLNTFVTTKITFANTLARLCEKLPGADVDVVTDALGLDRRIGPHYLKGALGYGGPCFPRDNRAMATLCRESGARSLLAEATDTANQQQASDLVETIKRHAAEGEVVAVLGLAYKPDTDVVEESQAISLCRQLAAQGFNVVAYDPAANDNARDIIGEKVRFADSVESCLAEARVVIIATPWQAFREIRFDSLDNSHDQTRILIDCWRILDRQAFSDVVYVPLGRGNRSAGGRSPASSDLNDRQTDSTATVIEP